MQGPLYNMVPPPGVAGQLGFAVNGLNALQNVSLGSRRQGYGLEVATGGIPLEVTSVEATIWGTPADESHDHLRGALPAGGSGGSTSFQGPHQAFFTLPADCAEPLITTVSMDSKLAPGAFTEPVAAYSTNADGEPTAPYGCASVPFTPSVSATPTAIYATESSGLKFDLGFPNEGLLNPELGAIAETEPVKTEVTLPMGMTINPSAAGGQAACPLSQFEPADGVTPSCPSDAKIGTLVARSPLLEEPIEGGVYLAEQTHNPFGSLVAIYFIATAPVRGVTIAQAGRVEIDQTTGQLTAVFDELPPVPYSSFELSLREGPRAPLTTPLACGSYQTTARLYPFSAPASAVERTAPFKITSGAEGGSCVSSESQLPNSPTFEAGTVTPLAGLYSPFILKLSRKEASQHLQALSVTLPPGLVGRLAGTTECSDAQIAQATSRAREGEGALEQSSPSCPAASEIGTVTVGTGSGTPLYVQGHAYLAGPYKGAPLSMVIITPAIAGPFDVGTVVVRAGLYVNESTAQITVKSDPIPTSLHGIPLDIRSIAVQVAKSDFTLNPTNCEAMAVGAEAISTTGQVAKLQNRFQVGGCKGLEFKPKLSLQLKGGTKRNQHPALKSVITYPQGESVGEYADIAKASVTLPASEFIDQAHIGNPCIRPDFAAGKCPKLSVLGRAKAWSPLLDKPLEGKVYFRSNGGERALPDVVADLNGQVHLVLVGFVDSVSKKGSEVSRLRTTFAQVPDAPVSKFILELKGGKEGLLVNSGNLCKVPDKAVIKLTAQNGKTYNTEPAVKNGCGAKKAKKSSLLRRFGAGW